jgi:hypothetical protein
MSFLPRGLEGGFPLLKTLSSLIFRSSVMLLEFEFTRPNCPLDEKVHNQYFSLQLPLLENWPRVSDVWKIQGLEPDSEQEKSMGSQQEAIGNIKFFEFPVNPVTLKISRALACTLALKPNPKLGPKIHQPSPSSSSPENKFGEKVVQVQEKKKNKNRKKDRGRRQRKDKQGMTTPGTETKMTKTIGSATRHDGKPSTLLKLPILFWPVRTLVRIRGLGDKPVEFEFALDAEQYPPAPPRKGETAVPLTGFTKLSEFIEEWEVGAPLEEFRVFSKDEDYVMFITPAQVQATQSKAPLRLFGGKRQYAWVRARLVFRGEIRDWKLDMVLPAPEQDKETPTTQTRALEEKHDQEESDSESESLEPVLDFQEQREPKGPKAPQEPKDQTFQSAREARLKAKIQLAKMKRSARKI